MVNAVKIIIVKDIFNLVFIESISLSVKMLQSSIFILWLKTYRRK